MRATARELTPLEQAAELAVLERLDRVRAGLGHDYGAAQRRGELSRRRDRLRDGGHGSYVDRAFITAYPDNDHARWLTATRGIERIPADTLRRAAHRVALPRIRRLAGQPNGGGTARTINAWQRVIAELEVTA